MVKIWVVVIACAQILVLIYMAGQREFIRATGTVVYFRTAPLDPRDPLRGDYVRLQYGINTLHTRDLGNLERQEQIDNGNNNNKNNDGGDENGPALPKKDDVLYVALNTGASNIASFADVSTEPPDNQIFIKGRVEQAYQLINNNRITMRYGIEQYFVEQGKGLELEEKMGRRGEMQIPLEVEVALGGDGTAVTRGYRWSKLGMQTETITPNREQVANLQANNLPVSPRMKITIQNVSDQALALVDNSLHCAFLLESSAWTGNTYEPASKLCANYQPASEDFVILAPDQSRSFSFDLSEARWHLLIDNEIKEIGSLGFSEQFRLIYHSPTAEQIEGLNTDADIWQGELPSQAFYASGRID